MSFYNGFKKTAGFTNIDIEDGTPPNWGIGYDPRLVSGYANIEPIGKKVPRGEPAVKHRKASNKNGSDTTAAIRV